MTSNLACIIMHHKWVYPTAGGTFRNVTPGTRQQLMAWCGRENCEAQVWEDVPND